MLFMMIVVKMCWLKVVLRVFSENSMCRCWFDRVWYWCRWLFRLFRCWWSRRLVVWDMGNFFEMNSFNFRFCNVLLYLDMGWFVCRGCLMIWLW